MQRTRPKGRPAGTSRQSRRSAGQTQATQRFARSRKPEQSSVEKLMQRVRGVLPGDGTSSAKRDKGSKASIPVIGGLLTSPGRKKGRGPGRTRKSAMFGVLGAGAAGAAAAAATRRSRSSRPQAGDPGGTPEAQTAPTPPTPATPPDAPDAQASDPPDGPAAEDQRA